MTGADGVVGLTEALAPVREAVLARARHEADALVAQARAAADREVAQAEAEATALREQARAEGEADAASVLVSAHTRAERNARGMVLVARREIFEDLLRRVRDAAPELRGDAAYPAFLGQLRERAAVLLGPQVQVSEAPEGGVVAHAPGRRFVCTLPDLAEQAAAAMGGDLERSWS